LEKRPLQEQLAQPSSWLLLLQSGVVEEERLLAKVRACWLEKRAGEPDEHSLQGCGDHGG